MSLPVIVLFALSFFLGTSEFVVVGILSQIASGLGVSLSAAGSAVSVFAFAYAIGTPLFSAYASHHERRRFMMLCTILFIVFNILGALSPFYVFFLLCRLVIAVLSGTILSLSMASANDIATDENRAQVVSMVFTGFSAASVFGVPIATSLSQLFGWRAVFIIVALATSLLLPLLYRIIPSCGKVERSGLLGQLRLFGDRSILLGVLTVIFTAAASYTFYTYLNPILEERLGLTGGGLSLALLVYGLAALASNLLSGRIARSRTLSGIQGVFIAQATLLALLTPSLGNIIAASAVILSLGVVMYLVNSPSQLHFLSTAKREVPECVNLASSLSPVCFNLGIALGSALGGLVMDGPGLAFLGPAGAVMALLALVSCLLLKRVEA